MSWGLVIIQHLDHHFFYFLSCLTLSVQCMSAVFKSIKVNQYTYKNLLGGIAATFLTGWISGAPEKISCSGSKYSHFLRAFPLFSWPSTITRYLQHTNTTWYLILLLNCSDYNQKCNYSSASDSRQWQSRLRWLLIVSTKVSHIRCLCVMNEERKVWIVCSTVVLC